MISSLTITASQIAKQNMLQRKFAVFIFAVDLSTAMEPHLLYVDDAIMAATQAIIARDEKEGRLRKSHVKVIFQKGAGVKELTFDGRPEAADPFMASLFLELSASNSPESLIALPTMHALSSLE